MIAESRIRAERNAAHRRIFSKKYRQGVREGFGAPALFFTQLSFARTDAVSATVSDAWEKVGKMLNASGRKMGDEIGQGSRKARR